MPPLTEPRETAARANMNRPPKQNGLNDPDHPLSPSDRPALDRAGDRSRGNAITPLTAGASSLRRQLDRELRDVAASKAIAQAVLTAAARGPDCELRSLRLVQPRRRLTTASLLLSSGPRSALQTSILSSLHEGCQN